MKRTTSIRAAGIIATAILVMACGNRGGADATTQPSAEGSQTGESAAPAGLTGTLDVWTQPQGDDQRAIKAIGKAFEEANPGVEFKLLVISEDTYATKVNTALPARAPRTSQRSRIAPGCRPARSSSSTTSWSSGASTSPTSIRAASGGARPRAR